MTSLALTIPLAHAGHWLANLLYLLPVVILGAGILWQRRNDKRARVIDAPPLPDGWLGKQWACNQGAAIARGELLCFTDADTIHGSELLTRSVALLRNHQVDFVTVAGRQRLVGFWERVVQPHIFTMK